MARATLDGIGLTYQQSGEGPDVVLVHGLAASRAFWSPAFVSGLAGSFRVTSFDLRGHGYSDMPPSGYTVSRLAEDLGGLLDHLGIDTAHLVGHSFGGAVALRFAVDRPGRVASIVVADARVRALQPRQGLVRSPDWAALGPIFARCGLPIEEDDPEVGVALLRGMASDRWGEARRRLVRAARFIPFGASPRAARRWVKLLDSTTAGVDFRAGDGIDPDRLARLGVPTLAVYGDRSPNMPSGRGLLASVPGSELVVVPGTGHFHPLSRPDVFSAAVYGFLADGPANGTNRRVTPASATA